MLIYVSVQVCEPFVLYWFDTLSCFSNWRGWMVYFAAVLQNFVAQLIVYDIVILIVNLDLYFPVFCAADVPNWWSVGRHGGYLRVDVILTRIVVQIVIGLRLRWNGLLLERRRRPVAVVWLPVTAVVDAADIFFFGDLGLGTEYPLSIDSLACTHLDL